MRGFGTVEGRDPGEAVERVVVHLFRAERLSRWRIDTTMGRTVGVVPRHGEN
jgi:hypothetical protein